MHSHSLNSRIVGVNLASKFSSEPLAPGGGELKFGKFTSSVLYFGGILGYERGNIENLKKRYERLRSGTFSAANALSQYPGGGFQWPENHIENHFLCNAEVRYVTDYNSFRPFFTLNSGLVFTQYDILSFDQVEQKGLQVSPNAKLGAGFLLFIGKPKKLVFELLLSHELLRKGPTINGPNTTNIRHIENRIGLGYSF